MVDIYIIRILLTQTGGKVKTKLAVSRDEHINLLCGPGRATVRSRPSILSFAKYANLKTRPVV